ncbi:early light-induced protein 1, chloroplastic-like [Iris pallida]|uniref:Early light-induced protein 1, chloroplastic-like n=1 Tax=Iris pallida TaxID=29817 RepID=A0AAX6DZ33_IRIPA|nr:early light-induced protein 1, chloroplastic-like [Iris pallida]
MAASATLQSCLVSCSVPRGASASRTSPAPLALPSVCLSPSRRTSGMRIRCQAGEEPPVAPEQPTPAVAPPQPPKTPTTPKAPKVSTKFSDVLAFSGPAPERINGRLAMVGFVSAVAVELARGDDLAAQLSNGGLPWFVLTGAVFSAASLIPLFNGVSVQSKSSGFMNADAEMWNGRFAMLGLVALAFTEYLKGGPLV